MTGIYVIKDLMTNKLSPVFQAGSDYEAVRIKYMSIKDQPFKDDYCLMHIANFDEDTLDVKDLFEHLVDEKPYAERLERLEVK